MVDFRYLANAPAKQTGIRQAPPLFTELHLKEADNTIHSSKTIHAPLSLTHNDSAVGILLRLRSECPRNYAFTPATANKTGDVRIT
jgi:hypothetical protein